MLLRLILSLTLTGCLAFPLHKPHTHLLRLRVSSPQGCLAFPLHKPHPHLLRSRLSSLHASASDGWAEGLGLGGEGASDGIETEEFSSFLNQRTIQTFLLLLASLKDRHTAYWLEDFTSPILKSRDTESHDSEEQVLKKIELALKENTPQMEKEIKLLNYHGLYATNRTKFPSWESYFQQLLELPNEIYVIESGQREYELEINPGNLVLRLISVREQLTREWIRDLDVIAGIKFKYEPGQPYRTNLLFLENQNDENIPSPLRKGNFDLLLNLSTKEAIERILKSPQDDDFVDRASFRFLRNFYAERLFYFDEGPFGKADGLFEEILKTSPSVMQLQDDQYDLVDPVRVVHIILKKREQVANDFIEEALKVPKAHNDIRRLQLKRLTEESFQ